MISLVVGNPLELPRVVDLMDKVDQVVVAGLVLKHPLQSPREGQRLAFKAQYMDLVLAGTVTATVRLRGGAGSEGREWAPATLGLATDGFRSKRFVVTESRECALDELAAQDLRGCPPDQRTAESLRLSLSNIYGRPVRPDDAVVVVKFLPL